MEWINPKYAEVVKAMKTARVAIGSDERPPIRAFLVPDAVNEEDRPPHSHE
ncbi:hypothetical protein [Streptomyces sp. NPDC015125]|uniref:hypothetical protein n=1 Tax=Streptomyces sp. NPDC015125 TaxID=3364938 RepID=UPI0036FB135F